MAICQACGVDFPWLHKHHIVARSQGGSDDPSNLVDLCPNCHALRHGGPIGGMLNGRALSHTPEVRAKRAKTMRTLWTDPDYRRQQSESRLKAWTKERKKEFGPKMRALRERVFTEKGKGWSFKHERCVCCRRTERKHQGYGLCARCWSRELMRAKREGRRFDPASVRAGWELTHRNLLAGRWSLKHKCCISCGKTDQPHISHGRCVRCWNREIKRAKRLPMMEPCIQCRRTDLPHGGKGLCKSCYLKSYRLGRKDNRGESEILV